MLRVANSEKATLGHDNENKASKLKGANKKVKNAKEVAVKEGEKAKDAIQNKNQRLNSERKMKDERNKALADLQKEKKLTEELKAQLETERSGKPHMRDTSSNNDIVTAVVSICFDVRRVDFRSILPILIKNQMSLEEKFTLLYEAYKEPLESEVTVVGANYVEDEEQRKKDRLYEDMIEMPNGFMETAAEHDGRCSKRSLEAICRHTQARYNY